GKLRPVESEEVELAHAAGMEARAEIGGDGRRDQRTRLRVIVEPLEEMSHPVRHAGAALFRERARLGEVAYRQDAGNDLRLDAEHRRLVAKAEKAIGREEELRDRPVRARVDLAPEIVEIGGAIGGFRMAFRVSGD